MHRRLAVLIATVLAAIAALFVGPSTASAAAATTTATTPTTAPWPTVHRGDTGDLVKTVQFLLTAHGTTTTADGIFGAGTEAGVKTFQSAHGLTPDGVVGATTWPQLVVTVQNGSTGSAAKAAQAELNRYGYGLAVDGDFGPATTAAAVDFQTKHSLTADGVVSPATWNALVAGRSGGTGNPVFTVYLSPTGSDSNDGRTPQSPRATLDGAQAAIAAAQPTTDVEVRIAAGTYLDTKPSARWEFFVPGHSISLVPATWTPGVTTPFEQRPIFHGPSVAAWWLRVNLPAGSPGGDTNMQFFDLVVEHYTAGGMTIAGPMTSDSNGLAVPASAGLNHNVISGMLFRDNGSLHVPAASGFGGIDLVNSSNNTITNNQFRRLENSGGDAGLLHGVYLAHFSSHNTVNDNIFDTISGDPVRARNDSDFNTIHNNTFTRTGDHGYSDWFCDTDCVAANPGHTRECASEANDFADNHLVSAYDGGILTTFFFFKGDLNYAGGTGCTNEGQPRLRTRGNTTG